MLSVVVVAFAPKLKRATWDRPFVMSLVQEWVSVSVTMSSLTTQLFLRCKCAEAKSLAKFATCDPGAVDVLGNQFRITITCKL